MQLTNLPRASCCVRPAVVTNISFGGGWGGFAVVCKHERAGNGLGRFLTNVHFEVRQRNSSA